MFRRIFEIRMIASVSSLSVDRTSAVAGGVSRAHDGRVERTGIAMTAREPHRAAPRTGGVSSTERMSPGRGAAARITDPQSTERRKLSEGLHRQR